MIFVQPRFLDLVGEAYRLHCLLLLNLACGKGAECGRVGGLYVNDEAYTSGRAGFTLWLQGRGYVAVWRIFLGAELLVTIGLFGSRATSSKAVRRRDAAGIL